MILTERIKHTHTHLLFRVPNDYKKMLSLHGPTLMLQLKTVALYSQKHWQQEAVTDSQRVSIAVRCWTREMLLKTWNFRFRRVYCGHCAILSTLYNGYSAILFTVNGYCAIPTYNWQCAILSTEYSMNIAQHCPQIRNRYCSTLST